jgi:hypothetical protein
MGSHDELSPAGSSPPAYLHKSGQEKPAAGRNFPDNPYRVCSFIVRSPLSGQSGKSIIFLYPIASTGTGLFKAQIAGQIGKNVLSEKKDKGKMAGFKKCLHPNPRYRINTVQESFTIHFACTEKNDFRKYNPPAPGLSGCRGRRRIVMPPALPAGEILTLLGKK